MIRRLLLAALFCAAGALAQPKKIVVAGLPEAAFRELQQAAPEAKLVAAARDRLAAQAADADAVIGEVPVDILRAAKKLEWVQIYSAGAERMMYPEFRASGVVLTNAKIIQGPEIADHAMALLLALTRGINTALADRGNWNRGRMRPLELNGKTAVIVGVGGIGMQIAQRAHAFGMQVIGVDPKDIPYTYFIARAVPPDRLDTVLPQADVVFISAPITPATERMIGPRQFDLMKPGAFFIAVSRGRLYDTNALLTALDSKHLAGAGLDVTNPEPLPPDHALWKHENVVITPHIAGQSDGVARRRLDLIKENVRRFTRGEPLLNVVDKQKGY